MPAGIDAYAASAREARVAVRGLTKTYGGVTAVNSVNLDVRPGEVMAIVGDNGAGKSTLIKMLAGAITPDAGEIYVNGKREIIANPRDARRLGIETLYQDLGLVDVFTVPQNVFLGRELHRTVAGFKTPFLDTRAMRVRTEEVLARMEVNLPSLDRPIRSYSGGQRQAVAISRLLLGEVSLIIMDEPMAALGIDESNKVLKLIRTLKEKGESILVISHNLDHVFSVSDRIAVMKNGSLITILDTDQVDHNAVVATIIGGRAPDSGEAA